MNNEWLLQDESLKWVWVVGCAENDTELFKNQNRLNELRMISILFFTHWNHLCIVFDQRKHIYCADKNLSTVLFTNGNEWMGIW